LWVFSGTTCFSLNIDDLFIYYQAARLDEVHSKVQLASILLILSTRTPRLESASPQAIPAAAPTVAVAEIKERKKICMMAQGGRLPGSDAPSDALRPRVEMSSVELLDQRRERNRVHARHTRERKKELVSGLERVTIYLLFIFIVSNTEYYTLTPSDQKIAEVKDYIYMQHLAIERELKGAGLTILNDLRPSQICA
jgi:hypothetical protein